MSYRSLSLSLSFFVHLQTFISLHLSPSLNDRWGIKDDRATTFLHSSLFSAFERTSANLKPVHTDMLYIYQPTYLSNNPFSCLLYEENNFFVIIIYPSVYLYIFIQINRCMQAHPYPPFYPLFYLTIYLSRKGLFRCKVFL